MAAIADYAELRVRISALTQDFSRGMKDATSQASSFGDRMKDVGGRMQDVGKSLTTRLTLPLVGAGVGMAKLAGDSEAATTRMKVTFGDAFGEMNGYLEELKQIAPASMTELRNSASDAMGALTTLGVEQGKANEMTKEALEVAANLSAHMDIPFADALTKVQKGYAGNTDGLREMAYNINQAEINSKALELGLIEQGDSADGAARAQAVHSLVMEQSAGIMDAANRNADTFNFQMRALWGNVQDAGAALGKNLLPYLTPLVTKMDEWAKKAKGLSPAMSALVVAGGALVAAIGPLLWMLGGIAVGLAAIVSPVGLVVAGVGLVVAAFGAAAAAAFWFGVEGDTLSEKLETVNGWLSSVWERAEPLREAVGAGLALAFQRAADGAAALWEAAEPLREAFGEWLVNRLARAAENFDLLMDAFGRASEGGGFSGFIEGLSELNSPLGRFVRLALAGKTRLEELFEALAPAREAVEPLTSAISEDFTDRMGRLSRFFSTGAANFGLLVDAFGRIEEGGFWGFVAGVAEIEAPLGSFARYLGESKDRFDDLVEALAPGGEALIELHEALMPLYGAFLGLATTVFPDLEPKLRSIISLFSSEDDQATSLSGSLSDTRGMLDETDEALGRVNEGLETSEVTWEDFVSAVESAVGAFVFVVEKITEVVEAVTGFAESVGEAKDDFAETVDAIVLIWELLPARLMGPGEMVKRAILGPFAFAYDLLVGNSIVPDLADEIVSIFTNLPGRIREGIGGLASVIATPFANAYERVSTTLGNLRDDANTKMSETASGVNERAANARTWMTDRWNEGLSNTRSRFSEIKQSASERMAETRTNVSDRAREAWENTRESFGNLKTSALDRMSETASGVNERATTARENLTSRWNESLENTRSRFSDIRTSATERMTEARDNVSSRAREAWENLRDRWRDSAENTDSRFSEMRRTMGDRMRDGKNRVTDRLRELGVNMGDSNRSKLRGTTEAYDEMGRVMPRGASSAYDRLREIWNSIIDGISAVLKAVGLDGIDDAKWGPQRGGGQNTTGSGTGMGAGPNRAMAEGGVISQGPEGGLADGHKPRVVYGEVGKREYYIVPERPDNVKYLAGAASDMGYDIMPNDRASRMAARGHNPPSPKERRVAAVTGMATGGTCSCGANHSPEAHKSRTTAMAAMAEGGVQGRGWTDNIDNYPRQAPWNNFVGQVAAMVARRIGSSPSTYPGHSPTQERAIDFMQANRVDQPGDTIADFLWGNAPALGVDYLIWKQRIKGAGSGSWSPMATRGSDTQDHWDHVHASFATSPGSGKVSSDATYQGGGVGGGFYASLWDTVGSALWDSTVGRIVDNFKERMSTGFVLRQGAGEALGMAMDSVKEWIIGESGASSSGGPGTDFEGGGSASQNRELGKRMLDASSVAGAWGSLDSLWRKESEWNHRAENPSSGAYGIPQSLPGSKMASSGSDWRTNPATQIDWGLGYIAERYGSTDAAWQHSQANNWYGDGGIIPGNPGERVALLAHAGERVIPREIVNAYDNLSHSIDLWNRSGTGAVQVSGSAGGGLEAAIERQTERMEAEMVRQTKLMHKNSKEMVKAAVGAVMAAPSSPGWQDQLDLLLEESFANALDFLPGSSVAGER